MKTKRNFAVIIGLLLISLFAACSQYEATEEKLISVRLIGIVADEKAITQPQANDTMTSWTYSAEAKFTGKASGATKSATCDLADGSVVLEGFSQGLWEFTIHGFNSLGTEVYRGTQVANISKTNNTVEVLMGQYYDLTGKGTVTVSISAPEIGDKPKTVCVLKNASNTEISLASLTTSTNNGNFTLSGELQLNPGVYTFSVTNYDDTTVVGGQLITFKVIKGDSTTLSGNVDFGTYTAVNLNACTFSGKMTTGTDLGNLKLTMSVDTAHAAHSDKISYSWYVNGVVQDQKTTSSFTVKDFEAGYYCITCVAIYQDTDVCDITSAFHCVEI